MSKQTEVKASGDGLASDEQLVRSSLHGELPAFDELVQRYQKQATAVAFRLLNNHDDAMEVVQDAFLKAYQNLKWLSTPGKFGPWLMRIAGNLALNRRRARSLRKAASLEELSDDGEGHSESQQPDDKAVSPASAVSAEEVQKLIDRAIAQLPEMQRQALMLFSVAKMPQKQVAEELGCSVEAVKWHVFTARKKLKDVLKDYL